MRETEGNGVNLGLSSLVRQLLHATLRCTTPCGKLVRHRKRNVMGCGVYNIEAFFSNRSYCCVDVCSFLANKRNPFYLGRSVILQ